MSLVSLHHQAWNIPCFDLWRLRHILIVKIVALDSMENIYDLCLLFAVQNHLGWAATFHWVSPPRVHVILLWWPVFELEHLAVGEQANDPVPLFHREIIDRVVNFESDVDAVRVAAYSLFEHLFRFVFFLLRFLDRIGRLVAAIFEKSDSILQANVAWVFGSRHHDDRSHGRTAIVVLWVSRVFLNDFIEYRTLLLSLIQRHIC